MFLEILRRLVLLGAKEKHIKKKTCKQNFHGIVPGFWGRTLFMCFFFSAIRNDPKRTHKQNFGTHPVPGQSRKFVYVYVSFLSLKWVRPNFLDATERPKPGSPRTQQKIHLESRLFGGPTAPSQPDLPLSLTPPPSKHLTPDPILTQFGPEVGLFGSKSGPNHVQGQVVHRGVGLEG